MWEMEVCNMNYLWLFNGLMLIISHFLHVEPKVRHGNVKKHVMHTKDWFVERDVVEF